MEEQKDMNTASEGAEMKEMPEGRGTVLQEETPKAAEAPQATGRPAASQAEYEDDVRPAKNRGGFLKGVVVGFLAAVILTAASGMLFYQWLLRQEAGMYNAAGTQGEVTVQLENPVEPNPENLEYDRIIAKIRLLQKVINRNYLFDEDPEAVEEGIYSGMMRGLGDPYSVYYTEDEYTKMNEETSGTYSGIGALLSQDPDTKICTVLKVFPGSPAEEAGMQSGDILVSADGHEVTGEDLDYFVSTFIRGPENTDVEIVVLRGEKREEVTMNITRRSIDTPTVEWKMLNGKTGYISVSQFDIVTPDQFEKAVDELTDKGMTSLVIDLRNNPGGVVQSATRMLDYMLPDGLLVYTAGRSGVGEKFYATDGHEVNIPTAILMNGNSASASEIFAGAYKDYGRAKLVGTTSFGKGIVQFVLPLGDGSAVKITTQHYYTPNGFDLHGKGIEPDITVEPGEEDEIGGEKDAQLDAALKAVKE